MEEDGFVNVLIRTKIRRTVGDLKTAVAEEVVSNLYFRGKKLSNNSDVLAEIGVTPDVTITNSPRTSSKNMFQGQLSVNNVIRIVFGMMSVIKFPMLPMPDINRSLTIFSNEFRPALINLLNKLDPISFINFAGSCQFARILCRSRKSGISVPMDCSMVCHHEGVRLKIWREGQGYRTIYGSILKKMLEFPFHLRINLRFRFFGLKVEGLERVATFLRKIKSYAITSVIPKEWDGDRLRNVSCWSQFCQFLNEFKVKSVNFGFFPTSNGLVSAIASNIEEVWVEGGAIPLELFSRIRQTKIVINESGASAEYVKKLIEMVTSGKTIEMESWSMSTSMQDPQDFASCFEGIETVEESHSGPLPSNRPLACFYSETFVSLLTVENKPFFVSSWFGIITIGKSTDRDNVADVFAPFL